jgi:hypothetical protein
MRDGPKRFGVSGVRRLLVVVALVGVWLGTTAAPAAAGSLEGCSGSARSEDADGGQLDSARAADGEVVGDDDQEAFTASNPFEVDNDGVVVYEGRTDRVITDHTWSITIMGIEVASGGSENADGETTADGTFDLAEELPFKITGLVKVEGEIKGDGGSCSGSGYVKVKGNALTSPLTIAGAALAGLGVAGGFLARPRLRAPKGTLA